RRMDVDDRADARLRELQVVMEPPLRRGSARTVPLGRIGERIVAAGPEVGHEGQPDDVVLLHALVIDRRRREQQAVASTAMPTHGQVAGAAGVEIGGTEGPRRCHEGDPRRLLVLEDRRHRQSTPASAGARSEATPSRDAAATPFSVTRAVTRRAGVTSKPGFSAAVPSGAIRTDRMARVDSSRPWTWVTSTGSRYSISTAAPSGARGSIDDSGHATKNGTSASRAASAFR